MAVFQWGTIIRNRREEMGLSQEELADGICAVPTLSRIENGERMPTKNHFEMLMQRLGYSAMSLDFFTDKRDFQIHELKFKIRQAYMEGDAPLAKKYLLEFEQLLQDPTKIDQQFLLLYKTLYCETAEGEKDVLECYENALRLTSPKYSSNYFPHVLSYEEIILLNNIAISHHAAGDADRAISIMYGIKAYYEHQVISSDEAMRTQTMTLYNLSKMLGLAGRYDECIEVCDLGIKIARVTGRCTSLGNLLFNRGWAMVQRDNRGDKEAAEISLRHAYYFYSAMENQKGAEAARRIFSESFKDKLL